MTTLCLQPDKGNAPKRLLARGGRLPCRPVLQPLAERIAGLHCRTDNSTAQYTEGQIIEM